MSGVSNGIYIKVLLKASLHTTRHWAWPPYIYMLRQSADLRGDVCVRNLSELVWQFPRLPEKVVVETVTQVCHLKADL